MNDLLMNKIEKIYCIRKTLPDDLFITCASFEERFLGVPKLLNTDLIKNFILFKFSEPNEMREERIKKMRSILNIDNSNITFQQIKVTHGYSFESILNFHKIMNEKGLNHNKIFVTIDISTFTKDLLLNLLFYLIYFIKLKKLRLLYTVPGRYASPDEGWLSYGIKKIHIPPLCWNEWSPLKNNLLIIFLGFEEMRAWSLSEIFSADLNWVYITNPGVKAEWDLYSEKYNKRLLEHIPSKGNIPALNPKKVSEILSNSINNEIVDRYNIFVAPLGTKPQLIGLMHFITSHPKYSINLLTTTVVHHNVPYYSWDIGDTYELFFPLNK